MVSWANTEHLPNRLIHEKSPYLLQHAYNPVHWYPWNEDTLELVKNSGKPVFLSIGYSSCHWCHVMEEESFENKEIAQILNDNFIAIKVDREERPDIDTIYMMAVTSMTGRGGWPLSVWLTPDLKPFFGGTYFPPYGNHGRYGFKEILLYLANMWKNSPDKLQQSSDAVHEHLQKYFEVSVKNPLHSVDVDALFQTLKIGLKDNFDVVYGGFSSAPKFPMPIHHLFLMSHFQLMKDKESLKLSSFTLEKMFRGGIYDQIFGGFHRYSVDQKWHVPHFEKMLYDNALLVSIYVQMFQHTESQEFKTVVTETLDFLKTDMLSDLGGFFSALDADSVVPSVSNIHSSRQEKEEGAYYVWSKDDIDRIVDDPSLFNYFYGVTSDGNVDPTSDPHHIFKNKNVLYQKYSLSDTANHVQSSITEVQSSILKMRKQLLLERKKRPFPLIDTKILSAWNGLVLSAFTQSGMVLENKEYLHIALGIATFIKDYLYDDSKKILYRSWCDGQRSPIHGFLDDYVYVIQGLLDLYEFTFDPQWIHFAFQLSKIQNQLFYDSKEGGFFSTTEEHTGTLFRVKDGRDGVIYSANAIAIKNLVRLNYFVDVEHSQDIMSQTIDFYSVQMTQEPHAFIQMLLSYHLFQSSKVQIILYGALDDALTQSMLTMIHQRKMKYKSIIVIDPSKASDISFFSEKFAFIKNFKKTDRATAYICVDSTCGLPIDDLQTLADRLNDLQNSK